MLYGHNVWNNKCLLSYVSTNSFVAEAWEGHILWPLFIRELCHIYHLNATGANMHQILMLTEKYGIERVNCVCTQKHPHTRPCHYHNYHHCPSSNHSLLHTCITFLFKLMTLIPIQHAKSFGYLCPSLSDA